MRRMILRLLVILGLGTLAVIFLLKDPVSVLETLRHADPFWIAVIIVMVVLIRVFAGIALTEETRRFSEKYRLSDGIANAFTAALFNGITPSESGGQAAQLYLFKKQGIGGPEAAGILWLDFILYQVTMILTVLFLLILRYPSLRTGDSRLLFPVIPGFFVNAAVVLVLLFFLYDPRTVCGFANKCAGLLFRTGILRDREAAYESIGSFRLILEGPIRLLLKDTRLLAAAGFAQLARLLLSYSVPFFCGKALGIAMPAGILPDVTAMTAFVSMVNAFLPMPGSAGGSELYFFLVFQTIFTPNQAGSVMIIWRGMTYYLVLILGAAFFVYAKSGKEKKTGKDHVTR